MLNFKGMNQKLDVIGDIHGMVLSFRAALAELGYIERSGTWFHPQGRVLVSVGDLIDRGPDPLGCLEIMKSLIEDGCGIMVLGNHEINALHYTTCHSQSKHWLREHNGDKKSQFAATESQILKDLARWEALKSFLKKQPTSLELDKKKLRVIHACWGYNFLDVKDLPIHIDSQESLERTADKKGRDVRWRAVECCIKGPEQDAGETFTDKDGLKRDARRIPWWETYPDNAPYVAFGHYWFPWNGVTSTARPAFMGPGKNAVCLDFSLGSGGSVGVLRWPEKELREFRNCDGASGQ
jgi:hypothetical protein